MVHVRRGKLVEARSLETRTCQDEHGATLPAARGAVDHPGPARRPAETQAVAPVESVGGIVADPPQASEAGDEQGAANPVGTLVPPEKSREPAGPDVGDAWARQSEHRPAAVGVRIVHAADSRRPSCG